MSEQSEMLYVYDPLALHHIFVKEQYTYEETSTFIEYVLPYVGQEKTTDRVKTQK